MTTSSVKELFMSYPYMESNIVYSSIDEYNELQNNPWFHVVRSVKTSTLSAAEMIEACDSLESSEYFALDGEEFRVLTEEECVEILADELREQYADTIPSFIEVDWVKTAKTCIRQDGYAAYFSSYDGDFQIDFEDFMIFRTN